ncbi:MAG: tetratricopeptide repeat protein [Prosthecobacter sp.]
MLTFSTVAGAADRDLGLEAIPLSARSPDAPPPEPRSFFARALDALEAKDYPEALDLFEKAAATTDVRQHSLAWLSAQLQACQTLNLLGKKTGAVAKAKEIVNTCESRLGMEDPLTSEALSHLAFLLRQNGRLKEAEPVYAKNLAQLEDKHGEDSFFAAYARARLANLLMALGRMDEAEKLHRESLLAVQTNVEQEAKADHCFFTTHLGYCLHIRGKADEAATLMNQAYDIMAGADALAFTNAGSTLRRQAEFFRDVRQLDKARQAGKLCLAWVSRKGDADRIRFFYHDSVQQLYRSILDADGLKAHEIDNHVAELEQQARGGN